MAKTKVLIVTQEMKPYTALSEISEVARRLPQHVQENGMEIRILMPKYGTINERRHRLHEVVRLSGMNIIVDNDDFPLIIKVASLPDARMQVYFLDNEDFFKRKSVFENAEGQPFEDNSDRMVFFCKGVLETVKKFGWAPDIIHCHGWMTSLIPFYVKTAYKTEPLFRDSKVVYSAYNNSLESSFKTDFLQKASINDLTASDLDAYQEEGTIKLHAGATAHADAIVVGSESFEDDVLETFNNSKKPVLAYQSTDEPLGTYLEFYDGILAEKA
ncbi:MAG: glycogen/starch synthase [Saprospiraceae bacterium]